MNSEFHKALADMHEHDPIDFYGGPFSNFAYSPFHAEDQWGRKHTYPTNEHYFAAWKATTPEDHDDVLLGPVDTDPESPRYGLRPINGVGPGEAKAYGRKITLREDWETVKYNVMLNGLRHKFTIEWFRKQLLATGERPIREDSPTDFVWGYRNNGLNLLGKALMEIREEIR